jgi:AcrR family transcriptional regulator
MNLPTAVQPPPRRRSGRPEKPIPRGDLLRVARVLFATNGYAGVSMAEIAHSAGLQKSSLFHHFPTKDQLYTEVMDGVVREIGDAVRAALADDTAAWTVRLETSTLALGRCFGADSTRARLVLRELLNEDAERSHLSALVFMMRAAVDFFERGAAAGAWPEQDFRHLVLSLVGMHCFYFALPHGATLATVAGDDPSAPAAVEHRLVVLNEHLRRLLGIAAH